MDFQCPSCSAKLKAKPEQAGKRFRCPQCKTMVTVPDTEPVYSVAFSPDGRFCISGSGDQTLRLWDASMGQCVRTFEGHTDWVNSVAFSPDGHFCLSGSGSYDNKDATRRDACGTLRRAGACGRSRGIPTW